MGPFSFQFALPADLVTYAANPLSAAELQQLQNINANTLGATQWAALASATGNFGTAAFQPTSAFQPADADLTAIAALATATYGRSLLTLADAAAGRSSLGTLGQIAVGALSRDLTAANGNVDIMGLGFDPRLVLMLSGGVSGSPAGSTGVIASGNSKCMVQDYAGNIGYNPSAAVMAYPNFGDYQEGIGSLIADGFRLAWTKTGAPTGTLSIIYLALGN